MNFVNPRIIHDEPVLPEKNSLFDRIKHKNAYRIWLRTRLSELQNHRCCFCSISTIEISGKYNSSTLEHIQCVSHDGKDSYDNSLMSCSDCNSRRGTKSITDFYQETGKEYNSSNKQKARDKTARKREKKFIDKHQDNKIVWG